MGGRLLEAGFPEGAKGRCAPVPLGTLRICSVLHQAGVPHCERDDCSLPLSCIPGKENRCCSHCTLRRRK